MGKPNDAGDAGPIDLEDDCAGTEAWVGDREEDPADIEGSTAGAAGVVVSGAEPFAGKGLGAGEVGGHGDRTAGEVLFVDGGGAGAVGERDEELEPIIGGY